ncbi:hypothetical protein [Nocardioides mangrovi]|uniref:YbaB/EbfC DNA-binding family protein n=1 Tax=Nocardioides mangrovi TaxID=2874580 RepID=A0ABS7U9E2_9ACTN|nr:hypothetical protein [Nocardioides mangrovi]MBZ5737490.1 hypothetical protein [Nocardioides mangrovi]
MTEATLSTGARRRLDRLGALLDPDLYRVTTPTTGSDRAQRVELLVDPTGWVIDVPTVRLTEQMRDPLTLWAVVQEALMTADLRRMAANAELRGDGEEEAHLGRQLIAGERRVEPRPRPRLPRLERPTARVDDPRREPFPDRDQVVVGTSKYAEVRVRVGLTIGVVGLEADRDWLSNAPEPEVRYALREAFRDAYEKGEPA